ncbi:MAG: (Fe-S)-binding protein [Chloroflexi bacterium]|nr:(Fe-S)-binding protein [Chloroflexota bacterium]
MTETIELALKALEAQLNQPLETALEACARCGICAEACHYYRAEPRVEHIPAHRAEQLRSVYRYEHDFLSRMFPVWTRAEKLDETTLANLTEIAFSQCTLCRRCTVNCPLGVDTPLMMRAIRAMATAAGTAPEILVMLADAAIEKGNDPSFYKEMFLEQIADMEKQLREITGDENAGIPVEKQGAKILYVPLAGAHTILPPAVVFNAAKEDWTLSIFEASNYGVFLADVNRARQVAKRIVDEANRLGVKEIVISECGHAYACYRWDVPNWFAGRFDFKVRSLIEVLAEYIAEGKIKVDPTGIPESVTYHDSCNLARNGGLLEEPRYVLKNIVGDFREMTPNKAGALSLRRRRRDRCARRICRTKNRRRQTQGGPNQKHRCAGGRCCVRELPPADRRPERALQLERPCYRTDGSGRPRDAAAQTPARGGGGASFRRGTGWNSKDLGRV